MKTLKLFFLTSFETFAATYLLVSEIYVMTLGYNGFRLDELCLNTKHNDICKQECPFGMVCHFNELQMADILVYNNLTGGVVCSLPWHLVWPWQDPELCFLVGRPEIQRTL